MGNAAATPISAKEFEKYGITQDDIKGFNNVVQEHKRNSKSKKLEKKDLDNIHKYCMDKKKKKRSSKSSKCSHASSSAAEKELDDLLSKQLSLMDPSVTMTEEMSHTFRSAREDFGPPSVINVTDVKEEDFSVIGSASVMPQGNRGLSADA